ncbi:MAG: hypothetical protein M3P98_03125 [bacterium]|nr:hypothetical protein [bacterium]
MKTLILLTLLSFNSHASFIAISDLQTCEKADLFSHKEICEGDKQSTCVPFLGGFCQQYDAIDEIVNGNPIYGIKENATLCTDEVACEELRSSLCREIPESFFFYAMNANNGFEAYCTKITGYEQVNTGKKVLKNNPVKLAAHLAAIEAKKSADAQVKSKRDKADDDFKALDISKITTIKDLKDALKLLQDTKK